MGVRGAFEAIPSLAHGLNIAAGAVAHHSVSEAHGLELTDDWRQLV
jgi:alanine dehydrogenase